MDRFLSAWRKASLSLRPRPPYATSWKTTRWISLAWMSWRCRSRQGTCRTIAVSGITEVPDPNEAQHDATASVCSTATAPVLCRLDAHLHPARRCLACGPRPPLCALRAAPVARAGRGAGVAGGAAVGAPDDRVFAPHAWEGAADHAHAIENACGLTGRTRGRQWDHGRGLLSPLGVRARLCSSLLIGQGRLRHKGHPSVSPLAAVRRMEPDRAQGKQGTESAKQGGPVGQVQQIQTHSGKGDQARPDQGYNRLSPTGHRGHSSRSGHSVPRFVLLFRVVALFDVLTQRRRSLM